MLENEPAKPTMAPEDVSTLVGAIIENSRRLGLRWSIRPGIVNITTSVNSVSAVMVKVDGDEEATPVISLIGRLLIGRRVFVLITEVGSYAVGFVGLPHFLHEGETGFEMTSGTAVSGTFVSVQFQKPFTRVPVVVTNINSGAGAMNSFTSRARAVTTTGFLLQLISATAGVNTWTGVRVEWAAFEPTIQSQ